jgi:hypothetical protein
VESLKISTLFSKKKEKDVRSSASSTAPVPLPLQLLQHSRLWDSHNEAIHRVKSLKISTSFTKKTKKSVNQCVKHCSSSASASVAATWKSVGQPP